MKTNEKPEKLYIVLNELTEDGRTFVLDHRVDYPTCTEYTRTDAFVNKACEWLSKHAKKYYFNKEGHYLGTDELVEDFKLSMEL